MNIEISRLTKDKKTLVLWAITVLLIVFAVTFSFVQKNSEQSNKARANEITKQLRCLECEGLSVYDSNTSISSAIKKEVSKKVEKGESNNDIISGYVENYGEFIRLNPTSSDGNWAVFVFPIIAFLILISAIFVYTRKTSTFRFSKNIVLNTKLIFWVLVALIVSGTATIYKFDISNTKGKIASSSSVAKSDDPAVLEKSLESQVKSNPSNENYRALGVFQFAQEDYLNSLKNLDMAVSLDANDATSQAYASYIIFRAEQYESARQRIDLAYSIDSNNISVLFFRGLIYREIPTISDAQKSQNLLESNKNFDSVIQLDPSSEFARQIKLIRS